MQITSIETRGDLWHGTALCDSKRYQWFATLSGSEFRIMEEERPGSEMWLYVRPPPKVMKRTVLKAIRAARH